MVRPMWEADLALAERDAWFALVDRVEPAVWESRRQSVLVTETIKTTFLVELGEISAFSAYYAAPSTYGLLVGTQPNLYNVADLGPFVAALNAHARRRVIAEITQRHPLTALNPLWRRFHGLTRPDGPTADDAVAALRDLGLAPEVIRWSRSPQAEYGSFAELVDVTRRRLCLPPEAGTEVGQAMLDLGVTPHHPSDLGSSGRDLATLSWAPTS
jgi:hypothetical protein